MQQQEKNNKGFNILELLVVLAIVGVISAVAYPNFSSWTKERKVRQASERIQSLMKNILIQTERGTFAYVQVLFENNDSNLIVTSKGMTMQTLATKINDANDDWNDPNKVEDRCNTTSTNYWDTDLDATSDEIKNAVYSMRSITRNERRQPHFLMPITRSSNITVNTLNAVHQMLSSQSLDYQEIFLAGAIEDRNMGNNIEINLVAIWFDKNHPEPRVDNFSV